MPKPSKKTSIPLTRKNKRVFKAKKINVMIAEADPKTRKARRLITEKVAKMSLDELRKELTDKQLLKNGKNKVPEEMLRTMMLDALSLSEGK
jgi:homoserine kinase